MSSIISRFAGLAAASLVGQLIGFLALTYVARRIGPSNLGAYNFSMTFASYAGLLANAGLSYKGLRDIAADPTCAVKVVREVLALQSVVAVAVWAGLFALAPAITPNQAAREILPIVAVGPLLAGLTLDWPLLALSQTRPVALWRTAGQIVYGAGVPLLVTAGIAGTLRYAELNMLGLAVTAGGLWFASRRVRIRRVAAPLDLITRLRTSIPYATILVLLQLLAGMGPLALGYLSSTTSVGLFAVAYKIPTALIGLTQMWLGVFLPHAIKQARENPPALVRELELLLSAGIVISVAAGTDAMICGRRLIPDLFGTHYAQGSVAFVLLSFSAGIVTIQACVTEGTLIALDRQRWYLNSLLLGLPIMVLLEVTLVSLFGLTGAGVAAILCDLYLAASGLLGVRSRLGSLRIRYDVLLRGIISVALMAAAMLTAQVLWGLIPGVVAGGAAGALMVYMTGLIHAFG